MRWGNRVDADARPIVGNYFGSSRTAWNGIASVDTGVIDHAGTTGPIAELVYYRERQLPGNIFINLLRDGVYGNPRLKRSS